MTEPERRNHERLSNIEHRLSFRRMESVPVAAESETQARLLDYGGGGVRFACPEHLPKNTQILIRMEFPGWQEGNETWMKTGEVEHAGRLTLIGAVMWSLASEGEPGVFETGVRFIGRITAST